MDTDQIAEWQSCTASSITSAFDHGTPRSDFLDIFQDDASDSEHSDLSVSSDADLMLLIKDIYSYDQLPFDPLSLKSTHASHVHRDDHVQLSSAIKYLVKDAFKGSSPVGTSPGGVSSHSQIPLPTELVMVVKMTVESVLQEVKQLPTVVTRDSVRPRRAATAVYRTISSDLHMDLWPVGDFLKAVLSNPWSEPPILDGLDFDRMLFDTARHHYADFSHEKSQKAADVDGMEVSAEYDDQEEAKETDQELHTEPVHQSLSGLGVFQQPERVSSIPTHVSARPSDLMEHTPEDCHQYKRHSRFKLIFIVLTFLAFFFAMLMTIQVCLSWYNDQPQMVFGSAAMVHPTGSPEHADPEIQLSNTFSALASYVNGVDLNFGGLPSATMAWFSRLSFKSVVSVHVRDVAFGWATCVAYACMRYWPF